jgi:YegS/Rv2252/BmrU family lipid kinase
MTADLPFIIVNPKSGKGLSEQKWASITIKLRENLGQFDFGFTRGIGDAVRIAEEEAKNGRNLIVAMGGDGTISEVSTGILRSGRNPELGILPHGTGGDLRRSLDFPTDLAKAAQRLRNGESRSVDVGRLKYIDHEGKEAARYFVNTASFGMSGKVALKANRSSRRLGGKVTFAVASLQTTLTESNSEVFLQIDHEEKRRLKVVSVCIANGRFWGGGMKVAPGAKLNDGKFDVVIIGDFGLIEVLANSYRLYAGSHLKLEKVGFTRANHIEASPVNGNEDVLLEVDGETPGRLPATFELLPSALKIRC